MSTVVASRVPRTQLGLLVGAALAVAGVVIQGLTRNPLGDPGLLGVNAGASASLVVTAAVLGGVAGRTVWAAVPGALLAAAAVYLIGSGGRRATPVRLVLAGAAVSAVLVARRRGHHPGQPDRVRHLPLLGGRRRWPGGPRRPSTPCCRSSSSAWSSACCSPARSTRSRSATRPRPSLGLRAGRTRLLGAAGATLLCAAAVAAVGPIAFVGLAVPHVVRSFTGSDHRWLLPYCLAARAGPAARRRRRRPRRRPARRAPRRRRHGVRRRAVPHPGRAPRAGGAVTARP